MLRARRVLTDSTFPGDELTVASVGQDSPEPRVTYNSNDDEYLIVWQSDDSGNWDILGQRVSANGVLVGTAVTITPPLTVTQPDDGLIIGTLPLTVKGQSEISATVQMGVPGSGWQSVVTEH